MSKTLKVLVGFLAVIVILGALAVVYIGFGVTSGVKSAKNRQDEAIKEVACAHVNVYLRSYYEKNNQYPETFEQWAPNSILKDPPQYSPVYSRTSPSSFTYSVTLNTGESFALTEKNIFTAHDPNVSKQCKEWLEQQD
jgi:type II secretory pathway pseudopilin PulG